MNFERYDYEVADNFLDYIFYSEGPKGIIKKAVKFSPMDASGLIYFNLSFGDWNDQEMRIDDTAITNNHDTRKILATVAATILTFIQHFPNTIILIEGSTASRTRLYQMSIALNWRIIEPLAYIWI